jgi:hypothetical protein
MKRFVFLGACLLALASQPVKAQTGGPDIVVVKVIEGSGQLHFHIARPGVKPEHREFNLKQLKEKGEGDYYSGQTECTRNLLVELTQQGYTLTTTYSASMGTSLGLTTLVFTKRQ